MRVDAYLEALREDLGDLAAVGDASTARAAELLAVALAPALARRMQEALAEAAVELSPQLERGRAEVRLAGGDLQLVYVDEAPPPREPSEEAFSARITLRLPESLKSRLEMAAAAEGLSVNTWLVHGLSRLVEPRTAAGRGRHRLTGYGRG
jgi:hypothetical protein